MDLPPFPTSPHFGKSKLYSCVISLSSCPSISSVFLGVVGGVLYPSKEGIAQLSLKCQWSLGLQRSELDGEVPGNVKQIYAALN